MPAAPRLLQGRAVPAVLAAAAATAYTSHGVAGYLTYHSGAYDLGFFDQVVEQTAQGHPFQSSLLSYSFLGQHWEPVLALWAPLDRIVATPLWLVVVNSLALAATPLVAWRLASAWLGDGWAPAAAAFAGAADLLVARGAAFPYHSEALTPVLALAALDGAARGQRWRFLLPAASLLLVKEDALLVAAGVGWIAWCVHRRRDALVLAAGALAAFVLLVGVVMPELRGGASGDLASRYAYLGGVTPAAMLAGALAHPDRVAGQLAGAAAQPGWAAALLPAALLPLLAGRAVLGLAPALLVALLAASPAQSGLQYHYGLEVFPLVLACSLLGWRRLRGWRPAWDGAIAVGLAGCVAVAYAVAAPLGAVHPQLAEFTGLERRPAVERILAMVPPGAAVSASSGLLPHLAARAQVYEFPDRAFDEPFVVLDGAGPRATWTLADWDRDAAALPAHGYILVASADGVTLWAR